MNGNKIIILQITFYIFNSFHYFYRFAYPFISVMIEDFSIGSTNEEIKQSLLSYHIYNWEYKMTSSLRRKVRVESNTFLALFVVQFSKQISIILDRCMLLWYLMISAISISGSDTTLKLFQIDGLPRYLVCI